MPHPALLRTFGNHRGTMDACALSADGRLLATADSNRRIRLWNTATGVERLQIDGHAVHALALSRDGSVLAAATHDRRLVLWDSATGRERLRCAGHVDALTGVALNLEHRRALTSSLDGTLRLWNTDSGEPLLVLGRAWRERDGGWIEPASDAGHWSAVLGCAISPCGTRKAGARCAR
jgi:WD40 repeat protein